MITKQIFIKFLILKIYSEDVAFHYGQYNHQNINFNELMKPNILMVTNLFIFK